MGSLFDVGILDENDVTKIIDEGSTVTICDIKIFRHEGDTSTSIMISTGLRKIFEKKDKLLSLNYLEKIINDKNNCWIKIQTDESLTNIEINSSKTKELISRVENGSDLLIAAENCRIISSSFLISDIKIHAISRRVLFKDDELFQSMICAEDIAALPRKDLIKKIQTLTLNMFLEYRPKEIAMIASHEIHHLLTVYLPLNLCHIILLYIYRMIMAFE
jgi:hypothetical protein